MKLDRSLIPDIVEQVNHYLRGERHKQLAKSSIAGDDWLACLKQTGIPPKSDGKSLGTCIEKLLKAEISRKLQINVTGSAAAGVDIPELSLNTKATSDKQPQSSEPFDSPYERVLGSKYDILACIYNGMEFLKSQKSTPIQITAAMYYERTEVADQQLCQSARLLRDLHNQGVIGEELAKRALRAIVYAKKSSAGYKALHKGLQRGELAIIDATVEAHEEEMAAKGKIELPNDAEWAAFQNSPLSGKISISFALQWRYQYNPGAEGVRCF
jgi:hypothetical protein